MKLYQSLHFDSESTEIIKIYIKINVILNIRCMLVTHVFLKLLDFPSLSVELRKLGQITNIICIEHPEYSERSCLMFPQVTLTSNLSDKEQKK